MLYNLYGYFFQESPTQVVQFRIDLSEQVAFPFELEDRLMPIRNSIFIVNVAGFKEALVYITRKLMTTDVHAGVTP